MEITHKLTVAAGLKGSYAGFTGSVNTKFGLTEKRTEKRHFLRISYTVSGHRYNITKDTEALKTLLDEDFKKALAKGNVDELFRAYGTHLIKQITIGGRAEYFCQSSDLYKMTAEQFKVTAKAKYKKAGGSVEGSTDVGTSDEEKLKLVHGSTSIEAIGGSAQAAIELQTNKWKEWAASCEQYPAFLGFDEEDGLLPI